MDKREPTIFLYSTIKDLLLGIEEPRERLVFLCAYANGLRIKEACMLQFSDIQWDDDFLMIRSRVLKKRDGTQPIRNSPISRKAETWLTEPIIELANRLRSGPEDLTTIWPFSKRTAQTRADKYFGATAHSLRHNRTSHLMTEFNYQLRDLQEFFRLEPASVAEWQGRYGHLEKSYLRDKWKVLENGND